MQPIDTTAKIIIPSHTRTIYIFEGDHPEQIYKFKLNLPDMELSLKNENFYYHPLLNGKKCFSPFLNTYQDGTICLGKYCIDLKSAQSRIYQSKFFNSKFCTSWQIYAIDFPSYLKFMTKWQESGSIKLKLSTWY